MEQRSFYGRRRKVHWLNVSTRVSQLLLMFIASFPDVARRDPQANNQVFFIDTSGALCSRASGHAIDIEGANTSYLIHSMNSRIPSNSSQITTSSSDTVVLSHSHFPIATLIPCLNSPTLPSPVKSTSSLIVIQLIRFSPPTLPGKTIRIYLPPSLYENRNPLLTMPRNS